MTYLCCFNARTSSLLVDFEHASIVQGGAEEREGHPSEECSRTFAAPRFNDAVYCALVACIRLNSDLKRVVSRFVTHAQTLFAARRCAYYAFRLFIVFHINLENNNRGETECVV